MWNDRLLYLMVEPATSLSLVVGSRHESSPRATQVTRRDDEGPHGAAEADAVVIHCGHGTLPTIAAHRDGSAVDPEVGLAQG